MARGGSNGWSAAVRSQSRDKAHQAPTRPGMASGGCYPGPGGPNHLFVLGCHRRDRAPATRPGAGLEVLLPFRSRAVGEKVHKHASPP